MSSSRLLRVLAYGWVTLVAFAASAAASSADAVLATPIHFQQGLLQGTAQDGLTVYRGIPFAQPPLGGRRWRAPQRIPPLNGTRDATQFKPACMQPGPTLPNMKEPYSEDCLYLNIWTPAKSPTDKLPVMVFIYGGGNASGSGSAPPYRGDQLAKKGVIVVTFNYRVGAFGTLAHPDLTKEAGTSGNYALLDIIAALRWVQTNIHAFGGDAGNVTLFGQSAGAYWESILMVVPQARGLFRRVIASSGGEFGSTTAHDVFPALADAEQDGIAYVLSFGVSSITAMRRIPADRIVETDAGLIQPGGATALGPNIDRHLIPDEVRSLYRAGKQARVDLLVGSNADEGVNTLGPALPARAYIRGLRRYGGYADRFLALYPARSDQEAAQSQMRAKADEVAWRELSWARFQDDIGVKHIYLYRFSTIPPFQPWLALHAAGPGAELPYVFGFPPASALAQYEAPDKAAMHSQIEQQIQSYWTNFAKTGDPNGVGVTQWPAFSKTSEKMLQMGDRFAAADIVDLQAMNLLEAIHAEQITH
jgi:para-nitrobenzyl esterase